MLRRSFRPGIETLEARDVPTVTYGLIDGGQTLKITGSKNWDTIDIVQDDDANTLEISTAVLSKVEGAAVSNLASRSFTSSSIKKIVVDLGQGDDKYSYTLAEGTNLIYGKKIFVNGNGGNDTIRIDTANPGFAGGVEIPEFTNKRDRYLFYLAHPELLNNDGGIAIDPMPVYSRIEDKLHITIEGGAGDDRADIVLGEVSASNTVHVTANLGDGNDSFTLTNQYLIDERASVYVNVSGHQGDDFIDVSIHGDIADRALVDLIFRGGNGNDVLNQGVFGAVNGRVNARAWGNNGADELTFTATATAESTGQISVVQQGNAGDDMLTFQVSDVVFQLLADVDVDGGSGANSGVLTHDVSAQNLDTILWMPALL